MHQERETPGSTGECVNSVCEREQSTQVCVVLVYVREAAPHREHSAGITSSISDLREAGPSSCLIYIVKSRRCQTSTTHTLPTQSHTDPHRTTHMSACTTPRVESVRIAHPLMCKRTIKTHFHCYFTVKYTHRIHVE